jgi:UDP-3-O-[3-hydroxymyristoyl] glucosamine N-acyltransferase
MMYRLSSFAEAIGLDVVRDGEFAVTGKLSTPLDLICVPLRSAAYVEEVNDNRRVAAVITTPEIAEQLEDRLAVATSENPNSAHLEIHALLAEAKAAERQAQSNRIDPSAVIDGSARIADYGVTIGAGARIGANVSLAAGVTIEEGTVLHPGCALGVPGFNTGMVSGRLRIVQPLGGVRIGEHCELLANCTIASAIFGGETTFGPEVMVDNLVYVAHDVQIGRRVQICALVSILGRTIIGDDAYIGPSAVVKNGLTLGARARINIGAVVTQDVAEGASVSGNFAIPHDRFLNHLRTIR